jgi:hypothetical protein
MVSLGMTGIPEIRLMLDDGGGAVVGLAFKIAKLLA